MIFVRVTTILRDKVYLHICCPRVFPIRLISKGYEHMLTTHDLDFQINFAQSDQPPSTSSQDINTLIHHPLLPLLVLLIRHLFDSPARQNFSPLVCPLSILIIFSFLS